MLSRDLKQLDATFDAWNAGRPYPTVESWKEFQRLLKLCIAQAMLLELGCDLREFEAAVAEAVVKAAADAPGSNIAMFPRSAARANDRGAS